MITMKRSCFASLYRKQPGLEYNEESNAWQDQLQSIEWHIISTCTCRSIVQMWGKAGRQ